MSGRFHGDIRVDAIFKKRPNSALFPNSANFGSNIPSLLVARHLCGFHHTTSHACRGPPNAPSPSPPASCPILPKKERRPHYPRNGSSCLRDLGHLMCPPQLRHSMRVWLSFPSFVADSSLGAHLIRGRYVGNVIDHQGHKRMHASDIYPQSSLQPVAEDSNLLSQGLHRSCHGPSGWAALCT